MLKDKNIFSKTQLNSFAPTTFITALFTIAKKWKQPKCPLMNKRIKEVVMYIYTIMQSFILPFLFLCSHQVWADATGREGEAVGGDLQ